MGQVRPGTGAGVLVREAGKDFGQGPAEVTEGTLPGKNNGHKLLNSPPGPFKSFSAGDFLKRNNATEAGMVGTLAGMGFEGGETTGKNTMLVPPKNKTLRGELVIIKETLFLDNAIGIRNVFGIEVFVAGE